VGATLVIRGHPELNAAAVAAVTQWRFQPAIVDGKPVATWRAIPVKFSLH
jgi:protein TonB